MTYVITGATGHLGGLVIDHLIARGTAPSTIVAGGRNRERLVELEKLGVRTAVIDYSDPATLDAAFAGATKVLLVSGSEVGQRFTQHSTVIDAAVRAGTSLVYTSAPKADTSELVLAPEHKATEAAILASGIPYTILRNNWYTENYTDAIQQAAASGAILTSAGDGRVASAPRSDYAEAAAVVLASDAYAGRVLELGGDEPWSFTELAETVASAAGRPVAVHGVTTDEHVAALVGFGLDEATAHFVAALDGNIKDGWLAETDHTLSKLIGHPTQTLRESVREILATG